MASEVGSKSRGEAIVLLQEGRALEDWLKAECQLVGAAGREITRTVDRVEVHVDHKRR